MLKVVKVDPQAKAPTVAHAGEDLAYDIYALENTFLERGVTTVVRTGVAVQAYISKRVSVSQWYVPAGLIIKDRSSMASKGITVSGGVIDHGYTGEIKVLLTKGGIGNYVIKSGDKIAQMVPVPILTGPVVVVDALEESSRGERGFGSSGR